MIGCFPPHILTNKARTCRQFRPGTLSYVISPMFRRHHFALHRRQKLFPTLDSSIATAAPDISIFSCGRRGAAFKLDKSRNFLNLQLPAHSVYCLQIQKERNVSLFLPIKRFTCHFPSLNLPPNSILRHTYAYPYYCFH